MGKPKDGSTIIGVKKMAEILGRSQHWASAKLREWNREQEAGGPARVSKSQTKNRIILSTTIAVLQREFVGAIRDPVFERHLKSLDRDVTMLHKRVDELTTLVHTLSRSITKRAS